ncbi:MULTISPECIES: transcription repressor NadR [Saccharibacillus]|uniref:transcription repressor NadR n=1 Tax=Saccharibacillus TaxID=456492 RepID=UPI001239B9DA|nr:transcription repressor NadR [Saccharibacillus sp. WB 17]MWJ31834.1 HTH domain-containing protein [Saccharibacillus sp. WB 17]
MEEIKLTGEQRREKLLEWLKASSPLTGSELARRASVSRQVIVQDITLLKAKNHAILATSQGYVHVTPSDEPTARSIIACRHDRDRTEEELLLLVDYGVSVDDVIIEHPVYGELTALIRVGTRSEVYEFIEKITSTGASYLSELTDGVHLHTISAPEPGRIEKACEALRKAGFLIED